LAPARPFNQEAGVFQNIFNAARDNSNNWAATFTQEWPLVSQKHQLSYSLAWVSEDGDAEFGDSLINYRYQAMVEGPGRPAFSPRVSVILPTASGGTESTGLQFNLPFSKQTGDVYWHWNAGLTWLPSVKSEEESGSVEAPFLAGSAIVRLKPMLNAMLETVLIYDEQANFIREKTFILSPGVRGGWNFGDKQLVLGFAVPITWSGDEDVIRAAFFYLSYELPFKKP
jgi:hypothetical protein